MASYITLRDLAAQRGITPDSLRQRIRRGTLKANKVGTTWVIDRKEAARVLGERADASI